MSFEHDRRVVIYSAYLNSKRTVSEGRRIPKEKACIDPSIAEIVDCCNKGLNLPAEIEHKAYSRDFWIRGRARVSLYKPDGSLTNPAIPNRKVLFLRVAELVPKHPARHGKKPGQAQSGTEIAAAPAAPAASSSAAPSTSAGKGNKGKKKRK